MGAMLGNILHAAYGCTLAGNMLWAAMMMKMVNVLGFSKERSEGYALYLLQACWRMSFIFSPWIRLIADPDVDDQWAEIYAIMEKEPETRAEGEPKKPLFVLGNHTSFLDTVLFASYCPLRILWKLRTYMDSFLFKMPILATICKSIGHFPVHFKSSEEGKFQVDKEKMELVEKKVDEHLNAGGWLCFFPEGAVNKDPDTLLPFRFGGMKKAIDFDARLATFVAYGNPEVWPKKAKVGGYPGCVRYSVKIIAPDGAKALVAKLRSEATTDEPDHALLATHAHKFMQQQYDALKEQAMAQVKPKAA